MMKVEMTFVFRTDGIDVEAWQKMQIGSNVSELRRVGH